MNHTMTICRKPFTARYCVLALVGACCLLFASCGLFEGDRDISSSPLPPSSSQPAPSVPTTVQVTLEEGLTAHEIADQLEVNGVCSAAGFLAALTKEAYDYPFLAQIPEDERIYLRLEGYLFADTYEFYPDEDPTTVIERFLANFGAQVNDELLAEIQRQGITLHQAITLASIIQEEASDPAEMPMVSSVFHNRLQSPDYPKLQSDVTIFYVRQSIYPFVTDEEKTVFYNAYSTYERKDLPVGPICNPGLEAIKAALYPAKSDYYFFLTDKTGKFYYAKTFAVHSANWEQAKAVNAAINAGSQSDPSGE